MLIDSQILVAMGVAICFSLMVSTVTRLRSTRWLCLLSLSSAAIVYRRSFIGFLLVNLASYVALSWLARRSVETPGRWRWACAMLVVLVSVFTLARVQQWDHPVLNLGVVSLSLWGLDMWLVLRLVTLLWEVGSGAAVPPLTSFFFGQQCR